MNNTSTDAQGIDCSVVIVTWNSEEFISDCINSLYKYGKSWISKIVVVDNHSTDRTVEILESQFPDVIVIKNRQTLVLDVLIILGLLNAIRNT